MFGISSKKEGITLLKDTKTHDWQNRFYNSRTYPSLKKNIHKYHHEKTNNKTGREKVYYIVGLFVLKLGTKRVIISVSFCEEGSTKWSVFFRGNQRNTI